MKVDFNGLKSNIAQSFNQLICTLNQSEESLNEDQKFEISEALNELRSDLLILMYSYFEEKHKDFFGKVELDVLNWEDS